MQDQPKEDDQPNYGSMWEPIPDELRTEFFSLIGRCIKEWAEVEDALFKLCELCLQAPLRQCAIIFYRTPTIDARLSLIEELARAMTPDGDAKDSDLNAELSQLMKDIRSILPIRNLLAHSPATQRYMSYITLPTEDDPTPRIIIGDTWLQVAPSEAELQRGKRSFQDRILADDMRQHIIAVQSFPPRILDHLGKLKEAQPQEHAPQSSGP